MSDETPDTTGLRQVPDLLAALQRSVDAAKAARAAHPTPDASPDPECEPECRCYRQPPHNADCPFSPQQTTFSTIRVVPNVANPLPAEPDLAEATGYRDTITGALVDDPDDPAVVTPDAGDVEALTEAERQDLRFALRHYVKEHDEGSRVYEVVERIVANHVAAAREADRAEVERLRAERDCYHARADVLRAKLSGGVALRGGKPGDYWAEWHRTHCAAAQGAAEERARAEAAEERLAGLVAKIEALADHLCDCGDFDGHPGDCAATPVINLLTAADAATALDTVREKAKAEGYAQALRDGHRVAEAALAEERERIVREVKALPTTRTQAWVNGWDSVSLEDVLRIARHTPEAT